MKEYIIFRCDKDDCTTTHYITDYGPVPIDLHPLMGELKWRIEQIEAMLQKPGDVPREEGS